MTNNNKWVEWKWTPEKPYPETLETDVWVKLKYGYCDELAPPFLVYDWDWTEIGDGSITHYKLAKAVLQ